MANGILGKTVPANIPGGTLTAEDMARVSLEDWAEIQKLSRGYCRTVDSTRSRKRMDGSATVVKGGYAQYGTDDVSDDVTQDAVLMFAQRLRDIIAKCATASDSTPDAPTWIYVRRDGSEMVITRTTLKRWAVRDAAARNGYRTALPEGIDETSGAQLVHELPRSENMTRMAVDSCAAQNSAAIFRTAYGDGSEFPIIADAIDLASHADDLGRAGIISTIAQSRYGGAYGSRRNVIRVRDAARAELQDLSERLDDARDAMVYTGSESIDD